jgi:O-antigen/teichoic acid export membrane protein
VRAFRYRFAQPIYISTLQSIFASGSGQLALVVSGVCAARILGAHDRGQLAVFALVPLILTVFGALGTPVATTYFIAKDRANARGVVGVIRKLAVVQALVITGIYAVTLIALYHSASPALKVAAAATLPIIPAKLAQDYGICILQGERDLRAFNVARALPAFAYAASVLMVFLLAGGHLLAVTLCYVITTTVGGTLTLVICLRRLPPESIEERNPELGDIVRFGLRALLGAAYPTEAFQIDQAFVALFLSRLELGLYVVGVSLTNFPRFLAQGVSLVAYPHVAGVRDRREARRAVWRFVLLVSAMSLVVCVGLELVAARLVPFFFGGDFRRSVGVAQILLIASFIVSIRRVLSDGMRGAGYPSLGTLAEVTGLLLLVPALAVLIPVAGLTGAAIAMPLAAGGGLAALLVGVRLSHRKEIAGSFTSGSSGAIRPADPPTMENP